MIYEQALKEHEKLTASISNLQKQLTSFPEGKLICTRNNNHYKWYKSNGRKPVYIPKKDKEYAEQLAIKKYLSLQLDENIQEKKAINLYLKHHSPMPSKSSQLLMESSAYHDLLSPYFMPKSSELSAWMNTPYEYNQNHPEHLIHQTIDGKMVRSKSEAQIYYFLTLYHIPFRYECALHLDNIIVYPDFTIRHPQTGDSYYWEHFGRMDDPKYSMKTYNKLQLYTSYGIIPTIQLITTYETQQFPLYMNKIDKIIQDYFL